MPIITVAMFSGRKQREKDRFAEAITDNAVKILGVERKDVIIVFQEHTEIGISQVFGFSTSIFRLKESNVHYCQLSMERVNYNRFCFSPLSR
jgi:4-oxalocrotonate tautomerase